MRLNLFIMLLFAQILMISASQGKEYPHLKPTSVGVIPENIFDKGDVNY